MNLKFSLFYITVFLLLLIIMMEFHEITHITVGYLICGCWGTRDFNVWNLCQSCSKESLGWMATLAGPIFSFAMMYLGMFWLSSSSLKKKTAGFALIFANIPFGRLTTVMTGGGDELVVAKHFLSLQYERTSRIIFVSVIMLLLVTPPIAKAYKTIKSKRPWVHILLFLTLPLLFLLIYELGFLNTLLSKGFLATPWIMGTPLLITIHTTLAIILLLWMLSIKKTPSQQITR